MRLTTLHSYTQPATKFVPALAASILFIVAACLVFAAPAAAGDASDTGEYSLFKNSKNTSSKKIVFEKTIVVLDPEEDQGVRQDRVIKRGENTAEKTYTTVMPEGGVMSTYIDQSIAQKATRHPGARDDLRPDLMPYKPSGWSDKIVVSGDSGTNTDSACTSLSPCYIDFAFTNDGTYGVSGEQFTAKLFIDGSTFAKEVKSVTNMAIGQVIEIEDVLENFALGGTHSVRVEIDPEDNVNELDEANNNYSRSTTVQWHQTTLAPNLKPYKPINWDDTIVVSEGIGNHDDTIVYAGQAAYIDFAFANDGSDAINTSFISALYIDDKEVKRVTLDSLRLKGISQTTDFEHTFATEGTHTLKLVCDIGNTVNESSEGDNQYSRNAPVIEKTGPPNLTPYQPGSWGDKIIISNTRNTREDGIVHVNEPAYIDYCFTNNGGLNIDTSFSTALYVDDVEISRLTMEDGLKKNAIGYEQDVQYTFTTAGEHTVKIVCDVDKDVMEIEEHDNEYSRKKGVLLEGVTAPNITPHRPDLWENKIVVSPTTNTNTGGIIIAGQPTYIDYAYKNTGDTDIDKEFFVELRIDGNVEQRSSVTELAAGETAVSEDFLYVFTKAGIHEVEMVVDPDYNIEEFDEGDNSFTLQVDVVAPNPNLKPYTPVGWDDSIVVSYKSGTTTQATPYAGETAYIDMAFENDGIRDADTPFYTALFVGETEVERRQTLSLAKDEWDSHKDIEYTFLDPGTYTLKMVVDNTLVVEELDETDNEHQTTMTTSGSSAYTAWWYSPDNPGTGLSMDLQGITLFLVWYVYDSEGRPIWYVSWALQDDEDENKYVGDLVYYTGWEIGEAWEAPEEEVDGEITVVFTDSDAATVTWDMDNTRTEKTGNMDFEKYMTTVADGPKDTRDLSGWWIDSAYPGMGFFTEARGDTLYMGWYNYREDGSPQWWTIGGWVDPGGFPNGSATYSADIQEYEGGQEIGGEHKNPELKETNSTVDLTFNGSGKEMTITLEWEDDTFNLERYVIDDGSETYYKDADGDGYSDGTSKVAIDKPEGYAEAGDLTATSGDCNDNDASINPGADDICGDGIDQDCSGSDETCDTLEQWIPGEWVAHPEYDDESSFYSRDITLKFNLDGNIKRKDPDGVYVSFGTWSFDDSSGLFKIIELDYVEGKRHTWLDDSAAIGDAQLSGEIRYTPGWGGINEKAGTWTMSRP